LVLISLLVGISGPPLADCLFPLFILPFSVNFKHFQGYLNHQCNLVN
jgi:hypothetical protein